MASKYHLKSPFSVCLWLVDSCNLQCKYCYAQPFKGGVMNISRLLPLIKELADSEIFEITLAGGEPLLHPEILKIVESCLSNGIQTAVLTNGVLLTKSMCEKLTAMPNKDKLFIQVSIDSMLPEINNYTRGKTDTVVENIHRLKKTGLKVQLATVVHKFNYQTAHTIIDEFYPEIKYYHFLDIQQTDRSYQFPELFTTKQESMHFWSTLYNHSLNFPPDLKLPSLRVRIKGGFTNNDDLASLHKNATFDCASCSAGHTSINITTDFDVLGCDIAKDYTLMGNVNDKSFSEVWNSEKANLVRTHPIPACYYIKDMKGNSKLQYLKNDFKALVNFNGK